MCFWFSCSRLLVCFECWSLRRVCIVVVRVLLVLLCCVVLVLCCAVVSLLLRVCVCAFALLFVDCVLCA